MDSQGNVYYTDLSHVWKISTDGNHTIAVKNVHTHELFIDGDDNLYGEHSWYEGEASDQWGYYIWCLDVTGKLVQTVPPTKGFPTNNTMVRNGEGHTFWSEKADDHELLKKQTFEGKISLVTTHKFNDIRWLYASKYHDYIYVVDHLTVKKVDAFGKVSTVSDKLKDPGPSHAGVQDHHHLMGVWSDRALNTYVAVFGSNKVKSIDQNGTVKTVLESPKGWSPTGGLIAKDGHLWVMEFSEKNKTRVRKISSDGQEIIYQGE